MVVNIVFVNDVSDTELVLLLKHCEHNHMLVNKGGTLFSIGSFHNSCVSFGIPSISCHRSYLVSMLVTSTIEINL